MKNGQLKPGYNLQISTHKQFILNYSLHQSSTDTNTLIADLEQFKKLYNTLPATLTADAGYGSEENYAYLEQNQIEAFVKYNYFRKEQQTEKSNNGYGSKGQIIKKINTRERITSTGYRQQITRYLTENGVMEVNHNLERLKEKARQNLLSQQGIRHSKQRAHDVEPVFAAIKHNRGFKRFYLKGIQKVEIETGLLSIAHNIRKKVA